MLRWHPTFAIAQLQGFFIERPNQDTRVVSLSYRTFEAGWIFAAWNMIAMAIMNVTRTPARSSNPCVLQHEQAMTANPLDNQSY
jgi:hypothetical protein